MPARRRFTVVSQEPLRATFQPSSLLTLGDFFSLMREIVTGTVLGDALEMAGVPITIQRPVGAQAMNKAKLEMPPTLEEQLGIKGPITSRVPQKYLIQNQTGLALYYWSDTSDGYHSSVKPHLLRSGQSEQLPETMTPTVKSVKMVGPGGVLLARIRAGMINVKFEGNWQPIRGALHRFALPYLALGFRVQGMDHDSNPPQCLLKVCGMNDNGNNN